MIPIKWFLRPLYQPFILLSLQYTYMYRVLHLPGSTVVLKNSVVLLRSIIKRVSPKIPKKSLFPIYTFDSIPSRNDDARTRLTYDKILADIQSLSRDHGWIGRDPPDLLVVSVWLLLVGKYFIVGQTCTFWKMYSFNFPEYLVPGQVPGYLVLV